MDFQLTPDQRDLQTLVRAIAQKELKPLAPRWDRTHEFPWDSINALARAGVLGLTIPEQYGGVGRGWLEAVVAIEEIARACYQTAMAALGELTSRHGDRPGCGATVDLSCGVQCRSRLARSGGSRQSEDVCE